MHIRTFYSINRQIYTIPEHIFANINNIFREFEGGQGGVAVEGLVPYGSKMPSTKSPAPFLILHRSPAYSFTCRSSNPLCLVTYTAAATVPQTYPRRYKPKQAANTPMFPANRPRSYNARTPATSRIPAAPRLTCSNASIHLARFFVTPRIRRNAASRDDCRITSIGPSSPSSTAAATAIGNSDYNRLLTRLIFTSPPESRW